MGNSPKVAGAKSFWEVIHPQTSLAMNSFSTSSDGTGLNGKKLVYLR